VFVVFGGGGDLAWRKLVPSLFNLHLDKVLPEKMTIIAVDRADLDDATLRKRLSDGVKRFARAGKPQDWRKFAAHISYCRGDFENSKTYRELVRRLAKLDKDWNAKATHIFHLAVPTSLFGKIPKLLADAGLARDCQRSRVVIEKPIGYDLESARKLNRALTRSFHESQIFRIDHYLGKETVQNILAFRFANPLFEPIWDRRFIDHIAITVAEQVGVEHRGGYYDHTGALRDMVQNHLLQLLCLVAMEAPVSFGANEIRDKKVDVLRAIRSIAPDEVANCAVRGQYGAGKMDGKQVRAYRDEPGVAHDSNTETFAALELFVDNWRWHGVPFYLRTGKRLPVKASEISIQFCRVPHRAFPPEAAPDFRPVRLIISIQPYEGIVMKIHAKQPGRDLRLRTVDMRFGYRETFETPLPDAYEALLWDVMINDETLFMRADQVEAAWDALTPVLDAWATPAPDDFPNYPSGTWGPLAAEELMRRTGREWFLPLIVKDPRQESSWHP
jgi:glucose-6-phosphate 1-dehydrogenase